MAVSIYRPGADSTRAVPSAWRSTAAGREHPGDGGFDSRQPAMCCGDCHFGSWLGPAAKMLRCQDARRRPLSCARPRERCAELRARQQDVTHFLAASGPAVYWCHPNAIQLFSRCDQINTQQYTSLREFKEDDNEIDEEKAAELVRNAKIFLHFKCIILLWYEVKASLTIALITFYYVVYTYTLLNVQLHAPFDTKSVTNLLISIVELITSLLVVSTTCLLIHWVNIMKCWMVNLATCHGSGLQARENCFCAFARSTTLSD